MKRISFIAMLTICLLFAACGQAKAKECVEIPKLTTQLLRTFIFLARAQINLGSPTRPAWWGEEEPRSEQAVSNLIRRLSEVRDDEVRGCCSEGEADNYRQSKRTSLRP